MIFEKKDVLGDGVNIASRIHSQIDKSGIVISEKVYSDIKNKGGLEIELLGTQILKGVDSPIGIYKVSYHDESILDFTIDTGELVRPLNFGRTTIVIGIVIIALLSYAVYYFLPKTGFTDQPEKSVLVLPFDNYLESDTLDFLVDAMHNELNFNVARISALRVLSGTTANTFKNTEKSMKEITSEVGVDNVIKPTILCSGDSICLRIEIFNEEEEKPFWIKEYHEESSQILRLFNTITKEISVEIDVNVRPKEEMVLSESRTVDPDAYNAYAQGRLNLDKFTPQSLLLAIDFFNKALELDPDWAAPYAGIAEAYAYQNQHNWGSRSENVLMIYKNHNKAQELGPESFYYHYINAAIAVWTEFDWKKGEREFKKAIELNPSHVRCRVFYANLLTILRRTDDALRHGRISKELDPGNPMTLGLYGIVLLLNNECEEALAQCEKGLSIQPGHTVCWSNYWDAVACLGDYDRWFNNLKKNNIQFWEEHGLTERYEEAYYERGWIALLEEIIKANDEIFGLTNNIESYARMGLYMKIGEYNKAMNIAENIYESDNYNPNFPYLSAKSTYDKMKHNPRYIALLKKMNLPLD